MTVPNAADEPPAEDQQPGPPPVKPVVDRELLDRIFGTVLPETTRDERDPGSPTRSADDWYQQNRPPHHG